MTLGSTTLLGTSKGSALGVVAERFVSLDFLSHMKPAPSQVFFDQAGLGGGVSGQSFAESTRQEERAERCASSSVASGDWAEAA
jgi:hypothetical protein